MSELAAVITAAGGLLVSAGAGARSYSRFNVFGSCFGKND